MRVEVLKDNNRSGQCRPVFTLIDYVKEDEELEPVILHTVMMDNSFGANGWNQQRSTRLANILLLPFFSNDPHCHQPKPPTLDT